MGCDKIKNKFIVIFFSVTSSKIPVCPSSVQTPPCSSYTFLFPLCLILKSLLPDPPPASGLYVCFPPAVHDLSSADAAFSSQLASPCVAHGHHQRECYLLIPAGCGSSASPNNERDFNTRCQSLKSLKMFYECMKCFVRSLP